MKKVLFITLLFSTLCISAQEMKVTSFKHEAGALAAQLNPEIDKNKLACALIKIQTTGMNEASRKKLIFDSDLMTEIVKVDFSQVPEVWVYLSPQARHLEIKHPDLGIVNYDFGIEIESKKTYILKLKVVGGWEEEDEETSNYLIIRATPKEAVIYVDDEYWGIGEESRRVLIGVDHEYRIECDLYHTVTGKARTNSGKKTELDIQLKPAFGFISIGSKPEQNADVTIDGKPVGKTPYVSERLASGQYEVKVIKDMYKPDTKTIRVIDNDTVEYVFTMAPNFAEPRIKTASDAKIYVNDDFKGTGQWSGRLKTGTYLVEARKENHRTIKKDIVIEAGKNEEIDLGEPEPIFGKIDVSSEPIGADIFIDGKKFGTTPEIIPNILIGVHTIRLEKAKCATVTEKVTVEEGKTATVNLELPTGKEISFTSDPAGAKVYVDGEYLGDTPLNKHLGYGSHSLKMQNGSDEKTESIDVTVNSKTDYFFDLITGKNIRISSSPSNASLYIDNKHVGATPYSKKISYGTYNVYAEKGDLSQSMKITVSKAGPDNFYLDNFRRNYKSETFFTLNGAYSLTPNMSFGLTFGHVKHFGWFVSVMSGTDFQNITSDVTCDENGFVEGEQPFYNGEKAMKRLSIIVGGMMKFNNKLSMKIGIGYGQQACYWQTNDEQWYKNEAFSATGLDASAGLQFCFGRFVVSVDAVTTNFKMLEAKVGIGWRFFKHK